MHSPPYLGVSSLLHVFRVEDALEAAVAWRRQRRRRRTTGDDGENLGDTTSFYGRRARQERRQCTMMARARWQCDGDGDGVPFDGRVGERAVQ